MNRRQDDDGPILITQAAIPYDEEFAARKKRYSVIMACRIPCLLLAGVFGIGFQLPLVALAFIVLSVPLPWVAVLIANDRPPRKAEKVRRFKQSDHELEAVSDARLIEASEILDARDDLGSNGRDANGSGSDGRGSEAADGVEPGADDGPSKPRSTGTDG